MGVRKGISFVARATADYPFSKNPPGRGETNWTIEMEVNNGKDSETSKMADLDGTGQLR